MKIQLVQLFVTYFFLVHPTNGQCPSDCFCMDSSVTCSGLKSIPEFPVDTRYITISEIDVDQIPAGVFNRLSLLESIEIYDGSVGKISTDAFKSLSLLEFITLSELSIGTIESFAFNNITDTGSISLDMSNIDFIQAYAFFDMLAIDHIKVSSNKINFIDSFAFNTIDELLEFSFQSNLVKSMNPYAFSKFSNLYEFSMYLNTLDNIGCGSFEMLLNQTEEHLFYANKFNCSCNIVWASSNPSLKKFLFSSSCQLPGTQEKINWDNVSVETLQCGDGDKYECPSEEYIEMLIPNVRIPLSTTGKNTRPFSKTTSSQTSSSTEVQSETFSNKTNTVSKKFSTFQKLPKRTTKIASTKATATILTTAESRESIDYTKSVPLPTIPKIVVAKKTAELVPENNTEQTRGSHEPVSAVLIEDEENGSNVISLNWLGFMTVLIFTVIRPN